MTAGAVSITIMACGSRRPGKIGAEEVICVEDEKRTEGAAAPAEDVASARECTGLIPALPPDDAGLRACEALYAVHRQTVSRRMYRKK